MRECLGCETYAKYTRTHTHVSSCAHFMFASASVRPSVFVSPSSSRTLRFALAAPGFYLPARACSLYGPASGPSRSAVVPGGIRDDTSPMSSRRLGMFRRSPLATHRRAFARFIVHARRLTASRPVRLLYGLRLYKRRK